jgi:hypothetical protein
MGPRASTRRWTGPALAIALAASGCVTTREPVGAGALPAQGPVAVSWQDPAGFSEPTWGAMPVDRDGWIRPLAEHLRQRAESLLPPGHRLEVELLDVNRAGEYEPGGAAGANDIRILRDIYPPRIHLRFRHLDGAGAVMAEGERRLIDAAFLQQTTVGGSDPLRYEKRVLDDWLRRELESR